MLAWLRNLLNRPNRNLQTKPTSDVAARQRVNIPPLEPPPGNFYLFEFFIVITLDGMQYIGIPKQALRDLGKNPPIVRWATRLDLCYPNDAVLRAPWVDDATNGVSKRPRNTPEDWLGAEGSVGDKRFQFEGILQTGKNEVVYSLFNPELGFRTAYGFSLRTFGARPS